MTCSKCKWLKCRVSWHSSKQRVYAERVLLSVVVVVSWCAISSATGVRLAALLQSGNTTRESHYHSFWYNSSERNSSGNISMVNCSSGFYRDNSTGRCEADCGRWSALSESGALMWVTPVIIVLNALQVLGAVVVVVLCCIWRKTVLRYPTCFIVYSEVIMGVCWLVILVSHSNSKTLFCSSRNLRRAMSEPTWFCSFQGAVVVASIISIEVFEVFHAGAILSAVKFPFLTRRLERKEYTKYIHASAILIAILLSCALVGLQTVVGGGYKVDSSLTYCKPNIDYAFFTIILPMNILSGIVVTLLVLTFWELIKAAYRRYVKSQGWPKHFTNIQLKVLLSVTYIFMFSIAYLLSLGCCLEREEKYDEELDGYLDCESSGDAINRDCSRSRFEELDTRVLLLPTSLVAIGYPVVDMVYVLTPRSRDRVRSQRTTVITNPGTVRVRLPKLPNFEEASEV